MPRSAGQSAFRIIRKEKAMSTIINGYYIETGYGFNTATSTVLKIDGVDEYGRIVFGGCVFIGEWEDCKEYARTH